MKEKVHPVNKLDRLFKEFGDSDMVVVADDKYEYKIKRKRREL